MVKWNIEDTGFTLNELKETMVDSFSSHGLPIRRGCFSVQQLEPPGCVRCQYSTQNPGLYYHFTTNLGTSETYDGSISVGEKGQGYGRRLEEAGVEFCRRVGVKTMVLTRVTGGSEGFWRKMGYVKGKKRI
ncbi:MAG: hypothetical protein GF368_02165 [Candidatus Aenigmarchaeota archaeon]|nr:hypothetical protein [Candidatus Aenigmarchaeota archaeon]